VSDVKPKLTRALTMHLNGGSEFSELRYKILPDGVETGITRLGRTDGSPRYRITVDVFACGEEWSDVLETKGVGMLEWILSHIKTVTGPDDFGPMDE
jgi:hypothetical protein